MTILSIEMFKLGKISPLIGRKLVCAGTFSKYSYLIISSIDDISPQIVGL